MIRLTYIFLFSFFLCANSSLFAAEKLNKQEQKQMAVVEQKNKLLGELKEALKLAQHNKLGDYNLGLNALWQGSRKQKGWQLARHVQMAGLIQGIALLEQHYDANFNFDVYPHHLALTQLHKLSKRPFNELTTKQKQAVQQFQKANSRGISYKDLYYLNVKINEYKKKWTYRFLFKADAVFMSYPYSNTRQEGRKLVLSIIDKKITNQAVAKRLKNILRSSKNCGYELVYRQLIEGVPICVGKIKQ